MAYTNSSLVSKKQLTNKCNPRKYPITKITIHHAAGCVSMENLLNYLATSSREVSANYVLSGGKLGLNVEEKNRAWTSGNAENDHKAVTIEIANSSSGGNWPISDTDLEMLIKWCVDVCKRNNITKLYYDGIPNGSLTLYEMFASTGCPGPYIKSKLNYICTEVNKLINSNNGNKSTLTSSVTKDKTYKVLTTLRGYVTAADAISGKNAKRTVSPGTYYVYNETSEAVNVTLNKSAPGAWICKKKNVKTSVPSKKSVTDIAKEVIAGKWGNGTDRVNKLKANGYNADEVQSKVNEILYGTTFNKDYINKIANEVIQGKWGNGDERKKRLEGAGYNYSEIQSAVNKLL